MIKSLKLHHSWGMLPADPKGHLMAFPSSSITLQPVRVPARGSLRFFLLIKMWSLDGKGLEAMANVMESLQGEGLR